MTPLKYLLITSLIALAACRVSAATVQLPQPAFDPWPEPRTSDADQAGRDPIPAGAAHGTSDRPWAFRLPPLGVRRPGAYRAATGKHRGT